MGVRTGAPFVEHGKTGFVVDRLPPPGRQCVSGDEDVAALAKFLQAIDQAQSQSRKTVRLCAMEIFDTTHVVENVIDVLANIRTSIASDAVAADHLQKGNGIPWTTN